MNPSEPYPVGTPGVPWGDADKAEWLARQSVQRSYEAEILAKLDGLDPVFERITYGRLTHDPERYPLVAARNRQWDEGKPAVLVTGGVHGYETSGAQGALAFLLTRAAGYLDAFNIVVAPCVSPWGYETINRWNPRAVDPNRSFIPHSPAEEAAALMAFTTPFAAQVEIHIDLHETTDTDNREFRPALAARDARHQERWDIPDGFYTVADSARPVPEFQRAIVESVAAVTHIAAADEAGRIIGEPVQQPGVILYDARPLGLCMGMTDAAFVTTTEVYPDSPRTDPANCIRAQRAAVTGGLDYVRTRARAGRPPRGPAAPC